MTAFDCCGGINAMTHDIIIAIERSTEKIHQWKSWNVIIHVSYQKLNK